MKRPTSIRFLVLGLTLSVATTAFFIQKSRVPISELGEAVAIDHVAVTASSTAEDESDDKEHTEVQGAGKVDYRESSIEVRDRLARVTVYSDRAELTRIGTLKLKKGIQWLRFDEIASGFFPNTARVVAGESFSGKIVQVAGEEVYSKGILKPETRAKIDELRRLYGELLAITQRAIATDRQLVFVRDLKFDMPFQRSPASTIYRPFSANIDSLRKSIDEIHAKTSDLMVKREGLDVQMNGLRERIALIENELENQSSSRDQDWKTNFYVLVESNASQTVSFELHYQVPNAVWRPIYDIRAELNHEKGVADIKLVTAGMIEQKTGEDWKQVAVTLSSLDPVALYLPKRDRRLLRETRTVAPTVAGAKSKARGRGNRSEAASLSDESDSLSALSAQSFDKVSEGEAGEGAADSAPAPSESQAKKSAYAGMEEKSLRKDSGIALARGNFSGSNAPAAAPPVDSREAVGRSPSSLFTLDGLETIYPQLGTYSRALTEANRTQKVQSLDAKLTAATPTRIDYADSRLPAVQANGRRIEFTSPFPVDVKTDESPLKVPVHSQSLVGKLSYFAIPKNDTRVYLRAQTTNTTDRPILGGGAQVFMAGDLVSKTELNTVSEDSFFDVDLGVDRNVETKRIVTRNSKTSGIISSTHHTEVAVKIELANHHPYAIDMEVKDNYPRSPDKKIETTLTKVEPDVITAEKDYGVITWKVRVPARSKKTVSFVYDVAHPDNYLVSEFN